MASTASPEASEIRRRGRRRLIGAIALVMLLVVFIPMVLDSEPRPQRPGPNASIPPRENVAPLPAPAPVMPAKEATAARVDVAKAEATPVEQSPKPEPAKLEPVPVPPEAAKAAATDARPQAKAATAEGGASPKASDATASARPAQPALQGFAVQVGAFRDEAKLRQSREKLAAAGVVHYTERLDAKAGALTRLRAGPYPTREEAEGALVKLKRASIEGKVVPLP